MKEFSKKPYPQSAEAREKAGITRKRSHKVKVQSRRYSASMSANAERLRVMLLDVERVRAELLAEIAACENAVRTALAPYEGG